MQGASLRQSDSLPQVAANVGIVLDAGAGEELLAVRRECTPELSVRPGGVSSLRYGAAADCSPVGANGVNLSIMIGRS